MQQIAALDRSSLVYVHGIGLLARGFESHLHIYNNYKVIAGETPLCLYRKKRLNMVHNNNY